MGPKLDAHQTCAKTSPKNVQRILARMAPKMADRMFSNLSTFQSYLFLRKWVKNRSHLPSSWSALISRAVLPAAPFYSPGSPNIFITFLVSSSPSWSLIPMFFFPCKTWYWLEKQIHQPKKMQDAFSYRNQRLD